MNQLYRNFLNIRIESALAAAQASKDLEHHGLTGEFREILMKDIIRPFLPSDFGVGSGKIITARENKLSKQLDIVLFNKGVVPPIMFEEHIGLFPIESVLSVIEVKSCLNATNLRAAHESALELLSFDHLPGEFDETDINKPKDYIEGSIKMLNPCLFAYDTDYKGDEAERYDEIRKTEEPAIRMICVAQKSLWLLNPKEPGKWLRFDPKQKHDEIAGFLSVLLNSYKMISQSKGNPRFGSYIFK